MPRPEEASGAFETLPRAEQPAAFQNSKMLKRGLATVLNATSTWSRRSPRANASQPQRERVEPRRTGLPSAWPASKLWSCSAGRAPDPWIPWRLNFSKTTLLKMRPHLLLSLQASETCRAGLMHMSKSLNSEGSVNAIPGQNGFQTCSVPQPEPSITFNALMTA